MGGDRQNGFQIISTEQIPISDWRLLSGNASSGRLSRVSALALVVPLLALLCLTGCASPPSILTACANGNMTRVKSLVTGGEDVNIGEAPYGTPLDQAAINNRMQVAAYLIANGANVNGCGRDKVDTPLYNAASYGLADMVSFLLEKGADPNLSCANNREAPLHAAAVTRRQSAKITGLLLKAGGKVNVVAVGGITPLYLAAMNGHDPAAELLLANGANPNLGSKAGVYPLDLAVKRKDTGLLAALLKAGANPAFAKDPYQLDALLIDSGDTNLLSLVLAVGTGIHATNQGGDTLLHYAARRGKLAVMKLLLDRGIKVDAANAKGMTPLDEVAYAGNVEGVQLLLQHGANVNAAGPSGWTPLDLAAVRLSDPHPDRIVQMLVAAGARPGDVSGNPAATAKALVLYGLQVETNGNRAAALECYRRAIPLLERAIKSDQAKAKSASRRGFWTSMFEPIMVNGESSTYHSGSIQQMGLATAHTLVGGGRSSRAYYSAASSIRAQSAVMSAYLKACKKRVGN